jgi:large subunit ribosomal protein L18
MNKKILTNQKRIRRKIRVRSRIRGTKEKPRLSVFRSHKYIYAQLIDDIAGKTLVSASSRKLKKKMKKTEAAEEVGKIIAEKALKANITTAVFDRGPYKYHGRVKRLVESCRKNGLKI